MQTYELEQSFASVVAFILGALPERVTPYFHVMPQMTPEEEKQRFPVVYFPDPELEYEPQTLTDFKRVYILYAMFFGETTRQAFALAADADMRIHRARDRLPLLGPDGNPTGRYVRVRGQQSSVQVIEQNEASVQLSITWVMPYRYDAPDVDKIIEFQPSLFIKDDDGQTSTPRPRP